MTSLTGKKVLVTGAEGFIGSHLVEALVTAGCEVKALHLYNSFGSWGWLEELPCLDQIEVLAGDVRDGDQMRALLTGVEVVFHLAALISVPYSYSAPHSFLETNVRGTMNICRAALEAGCSRVVATSTSEVYGTALRVPIAEDHPLHPQSPYAASKVGADAMVLSYHLAYGLPVVLARPFNAYGPRQSARAVIPTIITQVLAGTTVLRLGETSSTRDFTFVTDTCAGLLALAQCEEAIGSTVNIGTGTEISIATLCSMLESSLGHQLSIESSDERRRPRASEVMRLCCDCSLLHRLTGFRPETPLVEGLRRTVEWFSHPGILTRYKPERYCV